jgi:glycerol kinase
VRQNWALDKQFDPSMEDDDRQSKRAKWKKAVERTLQWDKEDS